MKLGKKAKELLGALAPTIGTALGGPIGGIAGSFLADKLGVQPNEVNALLATGDPDTALKLKEIEIAFEQKMAELDIDVEKMHAGDRADARALAQATSLMPQVTLGVIFVFGYFGIVIGLLTNQLALPVEGDELIAGLIGVLTAGTIKVMDFFLGSSAGSKLKTVMNGKH